MKIMPVGVLFFTLQSFANQTFEPKMSGTFSLKSSDKTCSLNLTIDDTVKLELDDNHDISGGSGTLEISNQKLTCSNYSVTLPSLRVALNNSGILVDSSGKKVGQLLGNKVELGRKLYHDGDKFEIGPITISRLELVKEGQTLSALLSAEASDDDLENAFGVLFTGSN